MKHRDFIESARALARPFRVTRGERFRIADVDPGDTLKLRREDKPRAK